MERNYLLGLFVKENVRLLRKYYQQLVGNDKTALPLELTGIPDPDNEIGESFVDVEGDLVSENLAFLAFRKLM